MIEFSKPIDTAVLTQSIKDRIAKLQHNQTVAIQVLNVLATFHGKTISNRITTALTKALPNYSFYLDPPAFSSGHIKVYFKGDIIFSIYLKTIPDTHKGYDHQATTNDNQWIANSITSISKLTQGLTVLPVFVSRYNTILSQAQTLAQQADEYDIHYDLDIASNIHK